jgi:glycosyltransferase involved in cell wall biosynthesis
LKIFVATLARSLLGGVETYLKSVIPLLTRAGHEVTLAYEQEAAPGVPRICGDEARPVHLTPNWKLSSHASERPDVVLLNGLWDPEIEERLAAWAPTAYFAHNFWGVCISGSKRWGRPTPKTCTRRFGFGCLVHYLPHRCGGLNPAVALRMFGDQRRRLATIARCQTVLVASNYMRSEYERHDVDPHRIHVLPYFVAPPPDGSPWDAGLEERPSVLRLLFLGRITRLKGLEYLVRAAHEFQSRDGRRCTVVIGGDGPALGEIQVEAKRLNVPLECHGWVDTTRRDELIQKATLLVIPSTWPEPFGLVGLEAARLGRPAVAFKVGGIADWLEPGVNGEFADAPANASALAAALSRAVSSPAHYRSLCAGARKRARQFDEHSHLKKLIAVLEQIAAFKGSTAQAAESARLRATSS